MSIRSLLPISVAFLPACAMILGPHSMDTLHFIPPPKSAPQTDPVIHKVIPQYASARPHQQLALAYNSSDGWEVMHHPATGVILRRRLAVIFAYKCLGDDIGCRGNRDCGTEMLQVDEDYLGGADRWGEPRIHEFQSPNTAMGYGAYSRYSTCAEVEAAKVKFRGQPGVWTKD